MSKNDEKLDLQPLRKKMEYSGAAEKFAKHAFDKYGKEEKKGGFRRIDNPDWKDNICQHPEHNPPSGMYLEGGLYEYTCPGCKLIRIITVPKVTC